MKAAEGGVPRLHPSAASSAIASPFVPWKAELELALVRAHGGTRLRPAVHRGPLRVQRPFYPEGPEGPCHVYVLHPPGGVVSGDGLLLRVGVGSKAHALLTTPGATKLYRARGGVCAGATASIRQLFSVDSGATLEWFPHETIAYDGAQARVQTEIELSADAAYAGWEVLCLGRPAASERFTRGELRTELAVRRAGRLVYIERGLYRGGDPLLEARWGLAGRAVLGTLLVAAPGVDPSWVDALRAQMTVDVDAGAREPNVDGGAGAREPNVDGGAGAREPVVEAGGFDESERESGLFSVTLVSGVLVARFLGASTREARALFQRAYGVLRPLYASRSAVHPRIWST